MTAPTHLAHKPLICPFVVLIDSAEQQPYPFTGLYADADRENRPLQVERQFYCLGRHPESYGDYSLADRRTGERFIGQVAIERKSREDGYSTFLGFGDGHRERFEKELQNLAEVKAALVLIEDSWEHWLANAPQWGTKSARENAKTLMRSVLAWQRRYRVPWLFAGSRRLAEIAAFRHLEGFWKDMRRERRLSRKEAERVLEGL